MTTKFTTLIAMCLALNTGANTDITELKKYEKIGSDKDWLIDGSPYKSGVYRSADNQDIILSNGLIARRFRITPNCATVGFDNLMTGQAILRSVMPEAKVTLDTVDYDVGGLVGQPNQAFLLPEWLDALKNDPNALTFSGFTVGEPKEHMVWKRVRHHAPDAVWPPKGVYLRMDYEMSRNAAIFADSKDFRQTLTDFTFEGEKDIPPEWRTYLSKSHERSSFINEGKAGEIYALQGTVVYAERDLPAGTRLVELEYNPGTDADAIFGPGMAIIWENGDITKFNMCTLGYDTSYTKCFGSYDSTAGQKIWLLGKSKQSLDTSKDWTMRMRIADDAIHCEAKIAAGDWDVYRSIPLPANRGNPKSVRIGKIGRFGIDKDDHWDGQELKRFQIKRFAAYGEVDEKAMAEMVASKKDSGQVTVSVHYELYDGIPCMSKWLTVRNGTDKMLTVNKFTSEILAAVEEASLVCPDFRMEERRDVATRYPRPNIHVETDFALGAFTPEFANAHVVHWEKDPKYKEQVNYSLITPCLLQIRPNYGPEQEVAPGAEFISCRAFIMPYDSYDRDRKTLSLARMYRTITPWVTENPLMQHVISANWDIVKNAVDQCAEVGFEMLIMSFGSGFNTHNVSQDNLDYSKKVSDYAKAKGIEVGSYSLLSSANAGADNIVPPAGIPMTHGQCPSLASPWGQNYFKTLHEFFTQSGFALFENDGSYPGDVDTKARPPFYKGEQDSRWVQWRIMSDFYKWCRSEGIYLNVPDQYYLNGVNKCGMGYREVDWSLPRAQQVIITRQNIYDGTWYKTPSMGWMFVPLTQYQGEGQPRPLSHSKITCPTTNG